MKNRILFLLLIIPAAIGAASYWFGQYRTDPANETHSGPSLETTDTIDLGKCRPGEAVAQLVLKNTGSQVLVIDRLTTSCGCMALYEEDGSSTKTFEGGSIAPGQQTLVRVRTTIRPNSEKSFKSLVTFRTNEAGNPQRIITIAAELMNPMRSEPAELVLGNLRPGQKVSRTILLSAGDNTSSPKIGRIDCSRSDQFQVVRRDATQAERDSSENAHLLIAALDVSVAAGIAESLEAKISVFEEGDSVPSLVVPIVGVVRAPYTVSPATIVLPNLTGRGAAYDLNCTCRSSDGSAFHLVLEDAGGLTVARLSPSDERATHILRVGWPSELLPPTGETANRTIRLTARSGSSSENISVEVLCRRPETP